MMSLSPLAVLLLTMMVDVTSSKIIDLTYRVTPDIPIFPNLKEFNFTEMITKDDPFWFAINAYCTSEHIGTHLDAPYHFYKHGWKVDEIPIDRLVAPAVVIDISQRIDEPEKYALTVQDIEQWEHTNGNVPNNSIVFIYSGWGRYWNNTKKYIYNDKENHDEVRNPGFSPESVEWLIEHRTIVGLGVDTLSIEISLAKDFLAHRVGAPANVYNLENVANLDQMPPKGATVFALPIRIKGGTGAPARIIATLPD